MTPKNLLLGVLVVIALFVVVPVIFSLFAAIAKFVLLAAAIIFGARWVRRTSWFKSNLRG